MVQRKLTEARGDIQRSVWKLEKILEEVKRGMKKKPEIQDFKVPYSVYVNMHNGDDYIPVPLSNLDDGEINMLLNNFCREVRKAAGIEAAICYPW